MSRDLLLHEVGRAVEESPQRDRLVRVIESALPLRPPPFELPPRSFEALDEIKTLVTAAFPRRALELCSEIDAEAGSLVLLAEAATWSVAHGRVSDPVDSLRSVQSQPHQDRRRSDVIMHDGWGELTKALERVHGGRRQLLGDLPLRIARESGRILFFDPRGYAVDGVAEGASEGFFNFVAAPPWDTWGPMFHESSLQVIACWIPLVFVPLAERGERANAGHPDLTWARPQEVGARWLHFLA